MKKIIAAIIVLVSFFIGEITAEAYSDTRVGRWLWWVRIVNNSWEARINKFVDNISPDNRENYVLQVIAKINTLEIKIQNSSSKSDKKLRNLAFLWEVKDILEWRLFDIRSSVTSGYNGNLVYSIAQVYPSISSLNITITSNQIGKWYYIILPTSTYAPTANQVKSWFDLYNNIISIRWTINLVSGNNQLNISSLNQNTWYVLYFVAEDQYDNLSSNVIKTSFITTDLANNTTWQISLSANSISGTTLNCLLNTNTAGRWYYVILPENSTAPSTAQIRWWMWPNWSNVPYKWTVTLNVWINQFSVAWLASNTYYKMYLIEDDNYGVSQFNTLVLPFATWENIGYILPTSSYFSLNISSLQVWVNSASAIVTTNQAGRWYYIILPINSATPNPTRIKTGFDSNGNNAIIKWNMTLIKWDSLFNISWLSQNTEYALFYTYEDVNGNLSNNVIALPVKTLANSNSTSLWQSVNVIVNPSGTSLNWIANVNIAGRWYYIVLPTWANKPTSLQVKEWIDSKSNTVTIRWNIYLNVWDTSFSIPWLNSSASYVLYFTSIDTNRNLLPTPIAIPFSTR